MLPWLDPSDLTVLAQVGRPWLAAVLASGLQRAGKSARVPLKLSEFVGSVERLAWAKANRCPWEAQTCATAAKFGDLEVLQWAQEHGCLWEARTCDNAAWKGKLAMLQWAQEHDCPWNYWTSSLRRLGRAPGGAAVGASARLPVGGVDVRARRVLGAHGGTAMGAGARRPVERGDARSRSNKWIHR